MKKILLVTAFAGSALALSFAMVSNNVAADVEHRAIIDSNDSLETYGSKYGYDKKPTAGTRVKCPVMVGSFKVKDDTVFSKYKDKWYPFCCTECKTKFDADPEKYLAACPEDCPCPD